MRRRWLLNLVVLVLFTFGMLPLGVQAAPAQQTVGRVEVDPQVTAAMERDGKATFWVLMRDRANMAAAPTMRDWTARGRFVVEQLQQQAKSSQANLLAELRQTKATFRPFWIANAIKVVADKTVLERIAARNDVAQILPDRTMPIPQPIKGQELPKTTATEWGLDSIRAPQVWADFGVQGEGIVIANVDTGVQYDHPALVNQYRGTLPGGGFDHNYNWFDPAGICSPGVPCDNAGHGTHTMGTMVGSDGASNQIGVAPGARWIAAKGCEDMGCSTTSLLAAGEWILAPTDLNGANPRPDLRPNIVNNSWGGYSYDPFYESIVSAWVAAGIFPAFAIGNNGSACGTTGSPGNYDQSYGVAAFDAYDQIAYFSSRGGSGNIYDESKPNIAAPGVSVRSSVPGNGYDWYDGTSMATPHVAGTVALLWSAAPALIGDIAATRALLDQTAVDMADLSCGGTAGNNRVWGEGKLDAYASVDLAPRGPVGFLTGTVFAAATNSALSGVTISASRDVTRTTTSGISGTYRLRLSVGSYTAPVCTGYGGAAGTL